jgi:hypothetical protein
MTSALGAALSLCPRPQSLSWPCSSLMQPRADEPVVRWTFAKFARFETAINHGKSRLRKPSTFAIRPEGVGYEFAPTMGGFISGAYTHNVMSTTELESLSVLQREFLRKAIVTHYGADFEVACGIENPGCLSIKAMMKEFEDRKVRATRRASYWAIDPEVHQTRIAGKLFTGPGS